jgi:hypothetical protein
MPRKTICSNQRHVPFVIAPPPPAAKNVVPRFAQDQFWLDAVLAV